MFVGGLWGLTSAVNISAWELSERGGPAHPREHVVGLGAKQAFHLHGLAGRIDIRADGLNHSGIPKSRFIDGVLKGRADLQPRKGLRRQNKLDLQQAIIQQA